MSIKTLTLTAVASSLLFTALPAQASPQDDIQTCRAAITAQSNINMDDYRLRFERSKGYRVRTVYIKAIPNKGASSFKFECYLNRNQVTALKTNNSVLFASR